MKHKLLKLLPLFLLGGVIALAASPAAFEVASVKAMTSVSFTKSDFTGGKSGGGKPINASKDGVKITGSSGYLPSGDEFRIYSDANLTITSTDYEISEIYFTFNSKTGGFDSTYSSINSKEWSKKATSQAVFTSIEIKFNTSSFFIESISADISEAKTTYAQGSNLDLSGVKINGLKNSGGTVDLTSQCTFSPTNGTELNEVGTTVVNVTYPSGLSPSTQTGRDLTTSFNVQVTQGEKENVYTKTASIENGDKVIMVNTATARAAKPSINDACLSTADVKIVDNTAKFTDSAGVGVFEVIENDDDTMSFKTSDDKYLGVLGTKDDSKVLTFYSSIDSKSSWVMEGTSLKSTFNSTYTKKYLQFNSSTKDFRMYAKTQADVEFYKYTSGAEKIEVPSTANVLEGSTLTVNSTAKGFTPSTYEWTVSDSETLQIVGDNDKASVIVKGLKAGSSNLTVKADNRDDLSATCVVTVVGKKDIVLENGDYFIADYSGSHVMNHDLSDNVEPDYTDSNLMWTINNNGIDGDTYTIYNGSNYLIHNPDIKASSLDLTSDSSTYWYVSKVSEGVYTLAYSETGNELSCNPNASTGTWFAYASPTGDQNKIKLMKAGEYQTYEIAKEPTTKVYHVGEELVTNNLKVNAIYDNGARVDITSKITWDTLTEGTIAYGSAVVGGEERNIELENIQVYKGDASTFVVEGLGDVYQASEKIDKSLLNASITYKLSGFADKPETLKPTDFVVSPEIISEETTEIVISLAKDPTVKYVKTIDVVESPFVAANYIGTGDVITIGTLGYNPYEITGGVELDYENDKFTYDTFGHLPNGLVKYAVTKVGSLYTLKDVDSGFYLLGDSSSLKYYQPDWKSVYPEGDGHYEFNLNINIYGSSEVVTMKTTTEPDFNLTNVFSSMDFVGGGYKDYIVGNSDLANNKLDFQYWGAANGYAEPLDTVSVALAGWKYENNVFSYAIGTSSELPQECYFNISYDDDFEEWQISSSAHTDKQLYFNTDGKFGFYQKGSSGQYLPVMVFRDNDKPLQSTVQSLSVSFTQISDTEVMNYVTVGEQFPWTSALIVTANYAGGAHTRIPVGGYKITQMPDTSTIGPSTGKVAYGQNGHEIEKEFTIYVRGKTQAFTIKGAQDPLNVGKTCQLRVEPAPAEGEKIIWSSDNESFATIDENGLMTGVGPGYVNITATSQDGYYSDTTKIRIYQNVTSLSLDMTSITMEAGTSQTITPTVLPDNASNKTVLWSTSNSDVATVNSDGVVTGLSEGTAIITCTTQGKPLDADEPLTATCTVNVEGGTAIRVKGVSIANAPVEAKPGDKFQLSAVINPSDATDKSVTWSSNNTGLASVNKNGYVEIKNSAQTGKTVRITVKTNDGDFTASCDIKIKASITPVSVTGVTLDKTSAEIDVGKTLQLVATVKPTEATDKSVTWSSSDTSVATVSNNGVVTGVKDGKAIITVTTAEGGFTATCSVTVGEGDPTVYVSGVKLDVTEKTLNVGDSFELIATVSPSNATNKDVTWKSSDTNIAEVDSNGKVTAKKTGEVTITVVTDDGGFKATCKVKVVNKEDIDRQNIIILSSIGGGVAVVGVGCGVGIPLGVRARKRKHM